MPSIPESEETPPKLTQKRPQETVGFGRELAPTSDLLFRSLGKWLCSCPLRPPGPHPGPPPWRGVRLGAPQQHSITSVASERGPDHRHPGGGGSALCVSQDSWCQRRDSLRLPEPEPDQGGSPDGIFTGRVRGQPHLITRTSLSGTHVSFGGGFQEEGSGSDRQRAQRRHTPQVQPVSPGGLPAACPSLACVSPWKTDPNFNSCHHPPLHNRVCSPSLPAARLSPHGSYVVRTHCCAGWP